jgi:hypothetical protein
MHKPGSPATAVVGIEPITQGIATAKALDAAMGYETVQEAKANLPALTVVGVSYVATQNAAEFKPKKVYDSVDAAWDGNFSTTNLKKPW